MEFILYPVICAVGAMFLIVALNAVLITGWVATKATTRVARRGVREFLENI